MPETTIQAIPLLNLSLAFIPALAVLVLLYRWSMGIRESLYGVARMLLQLLIIGYFLVVLFGADSGWIILAVLSVMVLASSWIALRTVKSERRSLYKYALISIILGGGTTFLVITQGVLHLSPWYAPRYVVPLAGMIFGGAMNAVSLAADRLASELKTGTSWDAARNTALKTALIPITNSLFAVGLVSLPGMMTGQILSGISPLTAVRYQIMVMCMLFGASGLTAGCYLALVRNQMTGLTTRGPSITDKV